MKNHQDTNTFEHVAPLEVSQHKARWWVLLSSMKFAIWVLVLLGTLSVVSLFVGELADPKIVSSQPKDALGAAGRLVYMLFDMADPFRSWWYRLLIGGLCLSLLICVIERTPIIWKRWSQPPPLDTQALRTLHNSIVRDVRTDTQTLRAQLGRAFDWRAKTDDVWIGERGRPALWGPLAIHTGFLLIAVGGLVVSFGSFTTRAGGFAGEMITVEAMPFEVRVDSFRIQYYPLQVGQLVLAENEWIGKISSRNSDSSWSVERWISEKEKQRVALWDYDLTNHWDHERDRGNIQKFTSYVTIFEDSAEVDHREIAVNSPLRRSGYRLYQSSFDPDNPKIVATYDSVAITVIDTAGTDSTVITLRKGQLLAVPGDTISVTADEFLPHFKMDAEFHAYSASAAFVNPAVRLTFKGKNGFDKSGWTFANVPGHGRIIGKNEYKISTMYGQQASEELATIFEIKKTHGNSFLWLGFVMSTIGLLLSFYVTHRTIYVEWPSDSNPLTRVTGLTRKTSALYEHELDRILQITSPADQLEQPQYIPTA